jgi:maleylpyruvate isomerase
VGAPSEELEGCRAAHAALLLTIDGLTDDVARRPSRLPDWTVGHVLTHIARNADSVVRRLEGAARGEVVDQYVGGFEGRAADIERGAARPAVELVDDVRATAAAVEAVCASLPDEAWDRVSRAVGGQEQTSRAVVFSRWREVEVHHADLGLGYGPDDWPDALVERWLPSLLAGAAQRADNQRLLAWLLGRGDAPALSRWG